MGGASIGTRVGSSSRGSIALKSVGRQRLCRSIAQCSYEMSGSNAFAQNAFRAHIARARSRLFQNTAPIANHPQCQVVAADLPEIICGLFLHTCVWPLTVLEERRSLTPRTKFDSHPMLLSCTSDASVVLECVSMRVLRASLPLRGSRFELRGSRSVPG